MENAEQVVQLDTGDAVLSGDLTIPPEALGIVVFAHGSGSSRHSRRNRQVAAALQQTGLATLLMDLLTAQEEAIDVRTRHLRFDIDLLALRLVGAARWLAEQRATHGLPIGYFGASTGGGAALVAAADHPETIGAVVSRGGRPDLAGDALGHVTAPTLLIVGGDDHVVIDLNRQASARIRAEKRLEIVPGATHLFEEPGALERVADLASDWFRRHLRPAPLPGTCPAGTSGDVADGEEAAGQRSLCRDPAGQGEPGGPPRSGPRSAAGGPSTSWRRNA